MNLIPDLILCFGRIETISLLGFETLKNRKLITKAEMQQFSGTSQYKQKGEVSRLFKRI